MSVAWPKVTVISCTPMRSGDNNGALMKSLFTGWPLEYVRQVYVPFVTEGAPDFEVCGDYRRISPFGRITAVARTDARVTHESRIRRVARRWKEAGWLYRAVMPLRELWYSQPLIAKAIEREVARTRPDVVYALLGNLSLTKNVCWACSRRNVPLFVHVTDNFARSMYSGMPFSRRLSEAADRWLGRAVASAGMAAGICPEMANELSRRYGGEWTWFTTLLDQSDFEVTVTSETDTFTLIYSGNLGLGRWRSLVSIGRALDVLQRQAGMKAILKVYAPQTQLAVYARSLAGVTSIQLCNWIAPAELPSVLQRADALVHVESFDKVIQEYTRLSFSTKLSQYMMAGRCIFGFGPAGLASIQAIATAKAGIVATESNEDSLLASLARLLTDTNGRHTMACNARKHALEWYERISGQARFRDALWQAIARHNPGGALSR